MIPLDDRYLLERYLQNRLAPDEELRVRDRLCSDPQFAEHLMLLANEEALLREWAQTNRELSKIEATLSFPKPKRRRKVAAFAALAAMLLIAYGLTFWRSSTPKSIPSVAHIRESIGEVAVISTNGARQPAKAGRPLKPGERIETGEEGSFAVLQLPGATQLEVGAETLLEVPSTNDKAISVLHGFVRARVANPAAQSIVLSTPHANILARQTVCSSWSDSQGTRVELEEGEAELTQRTDGQTVHLAKGSYVTTSLVPQRLIPRPLPKPVKTPAHILPMPEGPVPALAFSPDGTRVATVGWKAMIKIWDRESGELLHSWRATLGKRKKIHSLAFSPDGSALVTCGQDRFIRFWNPVNGQLIREIEHDRSEYSQLAFSPDGKHLALLGGWEKKKPIVQICDPQGDKVKRFVGADRRFIAVAFSPDGSRLVAGDQRGMIFAWDFQTGEQISAFRAHSQTIQALAFSPDGKWLVSGGRDREVKLWSRNFSEVELVPGHFRVVRSLTFSPDSNLLAIATDGFVKLWTLANREEVATIRADAYQVTQAVFSSDGMFLATSGWKRQAKLWDLERIFGAW